MAFGGVNALLIGWASSQFGYRCATKTPADLQDVVPFARIIEFGGPDDDDDPTLIVPSVSVDWFGGDWASAEALAVAGHRALRRDLPGQAVGPDAVVTAVRTISRPAFVPWDDTQVVRFAASYRLFIKTT